MTRNPGRQTDGGGYIYPHAQTWPTLAPDVFLAPGAHVIGDVKIGAGASVWFNCVVRGDVNVIRIGANTNIQDGAIVHVSHKTHGAFIGDDVLIGHAAMIHGCTLQDRAFVGMNAIVMDAAVIESGGMLAAGALLSPGKVIKSGQLWAGRPARYVRDLTEEEVARHSAGTRHYAALAAQYLREFSQQ